MWLKEAAKNGDLIARARLATRNMDPISSEEFDGLLNDILIAGDPDALFEVSGLMRNPPAGSSVLPDELFGGSGLTEHAWAITSCRMGAAACQADSTLLNNICAEMGRCNYLSYEHFVTNELLPPADRARLQAAIREITSLIQGRSSKSP